MDIFCLEETFNYLITVNFIIKNQYNSLRANPLTRSPGQVKADSDQLKL